jgi:hypothetical protein
VKIGGESILPIQLTLPLESAPDTALTMVTYNLANQNSTNQVLKQFGNSISIPTEIPMVDLFTAAVELSSNYYCSPMELYKELRRVYLNESFIPIKHITSLAEQIEAQNRNYIIQEETIESALALVKPEGFIKKVDEDGIETYTAEIQFPIGRQNLLTSYQQWKAKAGEFGFHYDPYNFDSHPEQNFFDQILDHLQLKSSEVEDIYFTGAITDPQKTDFFVEYKGEDNNWHRYSPDFVIRRKDGRTLIVEIKKEHDRSHPVDGEYGLKAIATRKWIGLNPDTLKYEMIFTTGEEIGFDQIQSTRNFINNE